MKGILTHLVMLQNFTMLQIFENQLRNCLSFKKVHSKTQKSGYLLAN